jgi:hypothetical protein
VTESWPRNGAATGSGELAGPGATVPSPARMWNYRVGGKDNFGADREAAEKVLAVVNP